MSRSTLRRRARALAALTTVAGLGLAVTAVTSGAAQSVVPGGDCTAAYPVDELVDGAPVTGLTVDHGTTPEAFSGELIGVLDNGIAPGLDMIMVRLTSPEIDRVGGIWQGMSGSPVYAADGRLIGAVAYGLAAGASPVAGVTPFADMDDHLGTPATSVPVSRSAATAIARSSDVTSAQAREGFTQLPMPLGVSGVSSRRLSAALAQADDHAYLSAASYLLGRASGAAAPGPETIVAGGNIAASLSYGDIAMAGVGTATSVCDGRVVGFGHPLGFFGDTTESMHPADALYVQEDLFAPFKVANLGDPVGTITDDRMTGITGTFGPLPDVTTVTSSVTFGDRTRTGVSKVSVRSADALANTTFYEIIANHDRVVDGLSKGSESISWTIQGTDVDGSPFALSFTDRYASSYDLTADVGFDLGDIVYALGQIDGVSIDSINADSQFVDDSSTWQLKSLQQYRAGGWVAISRSEPAVAVAGHRLIARALLVSGDDTVTVPVSFKVPDRAKGLTPILSMVGGNDIYSGGDLSSISKARRYLRNLVRNDELIADFGTSGGFYGGGYSGGTSAIEGRGRGGFDKSKVLGPLDKVVGNAVRVKVIVR
ncbi:SpoIVB peptidase S55 domain-containing protein [Nocardioides sp.]|uniref:SpoIVB peptidase S55 domain-containing protein n=1 Tax=Nocardioides sp. TaxID=35761 RepID=UPI0031FEC53D|nr:hypothetical protein [Nocardioides sp.]